MQTNKTALKQMEKTDFLVVSAKTQITRLTGTNQKSAAGNGPNGITSLSGPDFEQDLRNSGCGPLCVS